VRVAGALLTVVLVALIAVGAWNLTSTDADQRELVPGANADRGRMALVDYGCVTCHTIPGVAGADGKVGPPLTDFAERSFVAGRLPNTTENAIRWITSPQEVEPGTAMPDTGISRDEARDVVAYLYTLGSRDRSSRTDR
jgi:cytochrome c